MKFALSIFLVYSNQKVDYTNNIALNGQKIYELSKSIAKVLTNEYQLKSGDIVCFSSPNHYIQAITLLSVWSVGGVCLFINEKSSYGESYH